MDRIIEQLIQHYIDNIKYFKLSPAVVAVVKSIRKQFEENRSLTNRQISVLRRCSAATNSDFLRSLYNFKKHYQGYPFSA